MKDTRVYRSADIGSNYYLVCTTVKLERNIIEQVKEWQATLNLHFIDFEKTFDSIHRDSMWAIMKKYRTKSEKRSLEW